MHEYDKLIKDLRYLSKFGTKYGMAVIRMRDAADAIEELSAKLDGLQFFEENITKLPNCDTCLKKNRCEFVPRAGEYCRINCPVWLGTPKEDHDA